ncbi:MAG: GbsR/MarR family transcriptional regulator [Flavobacteriaceae bacterium]
MKMSSMLECTEEKRFLVEELGLFFESKYKLPPLSARLYALVVLSSLEGYSFEELMQLTQASKSAVSTNLNLLVQLRFIAFYTKSGDRKRYFRSSGSYLNIMLKQHFDDVTSELKLVEKVICFNKKNNPEKFEKKGAISSIFQRYLEVKLQNIQETLEKIEAFNKIDQP